VAEQRSARNRARDPLDVALLLMLEQLAARLATEKAERRATMRVVDGGRKSAA